MIRNFSVCSSEKIVSLPEKTSRNSSCNRYSISLYFKFSWSTVLCSWSK